MGLRRDLPLTAIPDEALLARRALAQALVITRQTLVAWPTTAQRGPLLTALTVRLRTIVDTVLRANRCLDEPPAPALMCRLCRRLASLRGLVGKANDGYYRLLSLEADLYALAGRPDETLRCLRIGTRQLHFIQDYRLRDHLLLRHVDLALALRDSEEAAFACIRDLAMRRQRRTLEPRWFGWMGALTAQQGRFRGSAFARAMPELRRAARIASIKPRRLSLMLASVYVHRIARPRIRRALALETVAAEVSPTAIRAMGGAGDMLMMTPGLRALARKRGAPVRLLIPRGFVPLFEMNPDVVIRPIEDLVEGSPPPPGVIDLTDCPAVAGELTELPDIRTNRIDLFAAGMGVTAHDLAICGRRPFFQPTEEMSRSAEAWLATQGLAGGRFVIIQAQPAESYRTWPHMPEAAAALTALSPVVVVHNSYLPGYEHPRIKQAFGLPFGIALALACRASVIVGPDSAFIHLAGARAIPSVGVFGPTSGEVRTSAYPEARVVNQSERLACIPCWRNEFTECRMTQGLRSLCLDSLPSARVVEAVRSILEASD